MTGQPVGEVTTAKPSAPGATIDAEFPSRALAVFRNTSTTGGAELSLTVTGATSGLGMRYEANTPR